MQTVNASNRSRYEALIKVYKETDLSQEKGRIIGKKRKTYMIWLFWVYYYCSVKWLCFLNFFPFFFFGGWFIGSLASCPDPDIVLEVLNFLLSSDVSLTYLKLSFLFYSKWWNNLNVENINCVKVRSQDAIFGLSVSREGRETAWKWLQVYLRS